MIAVSLIVLVLSSVSGGASNAGDLPQWITNDPAFKKPTVVDSIPTGNCSISPDGGKSGGWLVHLNQKSGHGVEIDVNQLSIDPEKNDFLLISSWPMTGKFKQIKLLTGNFQKRVLKFRIPNTMDLFVLFRASSGTKNPALSLVCRRYGEEKGASLEPNERPTEGPGNRKETVFDVQLKGKAPAEYSLGDFQKNLKEAIRQIARRYATAHEIPFDEKIPTEKMVYIHHITFCPFEWPERHICASIKHSVFVSGECVPEEEIIFDYQLTADNLRIMWAQNDIPELDDLGLTVFRLPSTQSTLTWWALIVGLMFVFSLLLGFFPWNMTRTKEISPGEALVKEVNSKKPPRMKLPKHQRIPSFISANPNDARLDKFRDPEAKSTSQEVLISSSETPREIPNYIGSFIFHDKLASDNDAPTEPTPKQ